MEVLPVFLKLGQSANLEGIAFEVPTETPTA
jgi:hypothetical protein